MQCGFCTPGMIAAAVALLARDPDPTDAENQPSSTTTSAAAACIRGSSTPCAGPRRRCAEPDHERALGSPRARNPAAPPREGGPAFPHGGAWIHVGTDGAVHAFIGKVEVGQGTHTALALLVAEELGVPRDSVRVTMGDTDCTPWDIGTFGSRFDAQRRRAPESGGGRRARAARRIGGRAPGHERGRAGARPAPRRDDRGARLTPANRWRTAGQPAANQGA